MTTDDLYTFTADTLANPSHAQGNDFAITVDMVPRNATGEPESRAGSLGTPTYRYQNIDFAGTMSGSIISAIDMDIYNFFVQYPYVQDDIQQQLISRPGTVVQVSAKLVGTAASPGEFMADMTNNGTIIPGTAAMTFDDITSTVQTYSPSTANIMAANDILGLSIKQVGTTNSGNLLNIQAKVVRSS